LQGDPGGHWPIKVQVRLGYVGKPDTVLPVRFEVAEMEVAAAQGLAEPDYVWANDGDYGYGLFLPDARSARWIEGHIGQVKDGLLRAMLWGALWDLVREAQLTPERFAKAAIAALGNEHDEQIASVLVSRVSTALTRYIAGAEAERLLSEWNAFLIDRTKDAALTYGLKKDSLDALIATAKSLTARQHLRGYLSKQVEFNGAPVKQLTRWAIIERLLALDDPHANAFLATETQLDMTPEAGRSAYIAGVAAPAASVKELTFARYLDDPNLNEEWVSASLSAFNDPGQAAVTLPYLRPALDRLEWIRAHRRIFFLPGWINAFVRNQQSQQALDVVDRFLAEKPTLPIDIRRKVLEARDELERTVAVRKTAGAAV
jgi:aminopeptidase N